MTGPELIRKTFFEELDSQYTLKTIWKRTLQGKDKKLSYKDNTAKKFQRTGDKKQVSTSRRTDTEKTPEKVVHYARNHTRPTYVKNWPRLIRL